MVRKGGGAGEIIADVIGSGVSLGTSYYAYKNSDSFAGFLWLRFYYGFLFILFVVAIIGVPILLFFLFAKKSPSTTSPPVQPSK